MSLRAIGTRLFKHGTFIVRSLYKREFNTNTIAEHAKPLKDVAVGVTSQHSARNFALRNVGLHARRLFVDGVLNRVTNSLAADLRKRAAKRMLFGDSGPFLAFVGVSLASGTGILTKDDELEGICLEIREAVSKMKWTTTDYTLDSPTLETTPMSFSNLELSVPIAKGCSAVVYAAKIIDASDASPTQEDTIRAEVKTDASKCEISAEIKDSITGYPLAVKMMFNYDVQSSAMAILRAMYRETVPARKYYSPVTVSDWEMELMSRTVHLAPHPNVVAMYSVFTAPVPHLRGAAAMYPAALPPRLYPGGSGRNMSLFLVMKRYDCSLANYLSNNEEISPRTSLLLLAQLLEAVAHIYSAGVAHRDLKTDNILLDLQENSAPILVVTDFGCCLADKVNGLYLPYNSMEIDKGGNTALMAPEVISQQPGTFSTINYTRADLWAVGCIAYEIFGAQNPFYNTTTAANGAQVTRMRSADYSEEELPPLPETMPPIVKALVMNILSRNPKKRLEPSVAASVCQLLLWAPSKWLSSPKLPSSTELLQWLLCLTTKVLCEGRSNTTTRYPQEQARRTYPEYLLISSFLRRAKLAYVKSALNFIHQHN